jgi:SOS-response transcriptional repressor LexA
MWDDLTKAQQETLEFIIDYIKKNAIPPTYQEIAKANRITIKSVFQRLRQLAKKGYISLKKNVPRGISLTEKVGFSIPQNVLLSIYTSCKKVKSGIKLENSEGAIFLSRDLLDNEDEERFFIFKISEKSNISNNIHLDLPIGTLIIVEKTRNIEHNDKVMCVYGDEIVLGTTKKINDFFVLNLKEGKNIPIGGSNASIVGKIRKIIISF